MRIGIVSGEASGDLLGAGLIQAIREVHPDVEFEGIAGPAMVAAGCKALYPAEKLSVMGLVEVFTHYRELKAIQNEIIENFIGDPPDVYIGIDAPDFNLNIEMRLKQRGIKTVHYVSPSVWAWRQYRVKKISEAADLILTLFPFEADFYRQNQMAVEYVGHPLADMIQLQTDPAEAQQQLGLSTKNKLVAVLPGSRMSEVTRLTSPMLEAASKINQQLPGTEFVIPLATKKIRKYVEMECNKLTGKFPVHLVDGQSRQVMAAADAVMLASGTAALEAMLLKRPMVVCYKLASLSYIIVKRLLKTPYVSLPNILANKEVVKELIQAQANSDNLASEVLKLLTDSTTIMLIQDCFMGIHQQLKQGASKKAAAAVLKLIECDKVQEANIVR